MSISVLRTAGAWRVVTPVGAAWAQMTNFASHAADTGLHPDAVPLTFFRKASGSITGPYDDRPDLRLRLSVNGETRPDMTVADMIYPPLETIHALTRFQRLHAGDLLLTGTPAGTALSAPPKPVELAGSLLPAGTRWRLFFKSQARKARCVRGVDVVEAAVANDDGAIDLGRQRTIVRYAR